MSLLGRISWILGGKVEPPPLPKTSIEEEGYIFINGKLAESELFYPLQCWIVIYSGQNQLDFLRNVKEGHFTILQLEKIVTNAQLAGENKLVNGPRFFYPNLRRVWDDPGVTMAASMLWWSELLISFQWLSNLDIYMGCVKLSICAMRPLCHCRSTQTW